MRRLWTRLRYGRPCGAEPPWKLPEAGRCILPRRRHGVPDEGWHADGNGYIWNDELGRWRWMGPRVDLAEDAPYNTGPDWSGIFPEPRHG